MKLDFYIFRQKIMRKCLECGKELSGRIDKKFCDSTCRSSFNNKKRFELNQKVKRINKILKRNFSLLDKAYSENKKEISISSLLSHGFQFNYFTSTLKNPYKLICYNYIYTISNKGVIFIEKLSDY